MNDFEESIKYRKKTEEQKDYEYQQNIELDKQNNNGIFYCSR